ncbi:MAG: T9SS type A sorting domain-containing protein, partial [Cytophagales bacterium]|nr:T9SS type A sorting domain-containing protein [Cytophagales bacterium]
GGVAAGESLELRLADAAGRQVFRRKLTPNTTDVSLTLPLLDAGVYVLRVETRRWHRTVRLLAQP